MNDSLKPCFQLKTTETIDKINLDQYALYDRDIDRSALLMKLATKMTHKIIVTNVFDTCNIQIQLVENAEIILDHRKKLHEFYSNISKK